MESNATRISNMTTIANSYRCISATTVVMFFSSWAGRVAIFGVLPTQDLIMIKAGWAGDTFFWVSTFFPYKNRDILSCRTVVIKVPPLYTDEGAQRFHSFAPVQDEGGPRRFHAPLLYWTKELPGQTGQKLLCPAGERGKQETNEDGKGQDGWSGRGAWRGMQS